MMRGLLDMCVLACVVEGPSYGYGLLHRLGEVGLPAGSEASIYQVLKRLRDSGLVEAELDDSFNGPARKVYSATDAGRVTLAEWASDWCEIRSGVEAIVGGCEPAR